MKNTKVYFRLFFDLFLPRHLCLFCSQPSPTSLCQPCKEDLPWLGRQCQQCAEPLHTSSQGNLLCGHCLRRPPAFDRTLAPFEYQFPINHLIRGMKDQGNLAYLKQAAVLFSQHARQQLNEDRPELLIPVPLHPNRQRLRGYNQAEEWARCLGSELGIAVNTQSCQRLADTPHQQGLSAKERRRNLKRAFYVKPGFRARHIALIDDVMTTGTTLDLLAQQFRKQGVEQVDAWCFARTPTKKQATAKAKEG